MYLVSVITPIHNAAKYLDEAFESVLSQTWKESLEVSAFNDASTDISVQLLETWKERFEQNNIGFVVGHNVSGRAGGVGFGKNSAVKQSRGKFLCFLDADDVMVCDRIEQQLNMAQTNTSAIIGSQYTRIPEDSTKRYTEWSNRLTSGQLYTQIYTSFGPTLINPTWFLTRKLFDKHGGFREVLKGYPEDLDFFYKHLNSEGALIKINKPLLIYRYHSDCASFSVHEDTIWELRIKNLERNILSKWASFTIWNAGKQGRKLYRSLSNENRSKVKSLCDVDEKKIDKGYYMCEMIRDDNGKSLRVPIVHFTNAEGPFIICVKIDLTGGNFEQNLKSLNLVEGVDYYHFS